MIKDGLISISVHLTLQLSKLSKIDPEHMAFLTYGTLLYEFGQSKKQMNLSGLVFLTMVWFGARNL